MGIGAGLVHLALGWMDQPVADYGVWTTGRGRRGVDDGVGPTSWGCGLRTKNCDPALHALIDAVRAKPPMQSRPCQAALKG